MESLRILHGELLSEGPIFAGLVHFGPLWYYLLTLPQLVSNDWMAITFFIGILAALKYPLAYCLGRQWGGSLTGLLWALLLAFPGWSVYAQILPSHTSLMETCVLLSAYSASVFWRSPSCRTSIVLAFTLALALHAHPVCAVLFPIGAGLIVVRIIQGKLSPWALLFSFVSFVFLFSPIIYNEFVQGFPNLKNVHAFVAGNASNDAHTGSILNIPSFLSGTFFTGPRVVASNILILPLALGNLLGGLFSLVMIVGSCGALWAMRHPAYRKHSLVVVGAFFIIVAGTVLMRNITLCYMTLPFSTLYSGFVAWGIAHLVGSIRKDAPWRHVFLLPALLLIGCSLAVAKNLHDGLFRFSVFPMLDVKAPFSVGEPLPIETAWFMQKSGRWLCERPGAALHGAIAYTAFNSYAISARKACGTLPPLTLGGKASAEENTVIGISSPMSKKSGAHAIANWGAVDIIPARHVLNPVAGISLTQNFSYPPSLGNLFASPQPLRLAATLPCDEALIISNTFFGYIPDLSSEVLLNSQPLSPFAKDLVSAIYLPGTCPREGNNDWEIVIQTYSLEGVSVASFSLE